MKYDIMKAKPSGNSCRVRAKEPGTYYLVPIPYDEKLRVIDNELYLKGNSIWHKETVKRNYINLPHEYMNADILMVEDDDVNVYVKSDYQNHIIRKALMYETDCRVTLPRDYRENVLSYHLFDGERLFPEEWYRVEWVHCKPTTDNRLSATIYVPHECAGHNIILWEDELYDY